MNFIAMLDFTLIVDGNIVLRSINNCLFHESFKNSSLDENQGHMNDIHVHYTGM